MNEKFQLIRVHVYIWCVLCKISFFIIPFREIYTPGKTVYFHTPELASHYIRCAASFLLYRYNVRRVRQSFTTNTQTTPPCIVGSWTDGKPKNTHKYPSSRMLNSFILYVRFMQIEKFEFIIIAKPILCGNLQSYTGCHVCRGSTYDECMRILCIPLS